MNKENKDPKRAFSKKEKLAVELVSGRTGDADHINPHSKGGKTTVENCQIISPTANKKKGAFVYKPRKWQQEFMDSWNRRDEGIPFMLIAIPGSGKTMATLEVARKWIAAGPDRRVVIVVPTVNLKTQWAKEALQFGLELQTKEFGTNFRHGFHGGVATYHLVGNSPLLFRKLCSAAPTMVIFDEIHHCGEDSHFGSGIKEGFELAKEKISMSGTPWKSDGKPIPFVRYDGNGYAVGNYSYDYPHALRDGVVRYLAFDHAKGSIQNDLTGESSELHEGITDEEAAFRLNRLLEPDGEFVRQQVRDAHRKLCECRKAVPDAGGLAVCKDQTHALKIANVIKEETGCYPSIIVSDAELENDNVESFRKSSKEWLVAVKKVSEGTDIKRLQVLCYLTNTVSELFFRQVIGRVSRVRDMEDYEGYVYLPADPRLIGFSKNIENAQVLAIKEEAETEGREIERGESQMDFTTYTTQHEGSEVVLIGNEEVSVQEYREIERISESQGLSMEKVRAVRVMSGISSSNVSMEETKDLTTLEERCDKWRKKCRKSAYYLSKLLDCHPADVHKNFAPQKGMSESQLQDKHKKIIAQINQLKL